MILQFLQLALCGRQLTRRLRLETLETRTTMAASCCVSQDEMLLRGLAQPPLNGGTVAAEAASIAASGINNRPLSREIKPAAADAVFQQFQSLDSVAPKAFAAQPIRNESSVLFDAFNACLVAPCSQSDLALGLIKYEQRLNQLYDKDS